MGDFPLARDAAGHPVPLPKRAVGWHVALANGRPGRPVLLRLPTGAPLLLPFSSTRDALCAAGATPGAYRLEPVDAAGRRLKGAPAFVELAAPLPTAEESPPVLAAKLASLEQLAAQHGRALQGLTTQVTALFQLAERSTQALEHLVTLLTPLRASAELMQGFLLQSKLPMESAFRAASPPPPAVAPPTPQAPRRPAPPLPPPAPSLDPWHRLLAAMSPQEAHLLSTLTAVLPAEPLAKLRAGLTSVPIDQALHELRGLWNSLPGPSTRPLGKTP